jgi:Domain of unknown function (DUF4893)
MVMTIQVPHKFLLAALLTLASGSAWAGWQDQITPYDQQRLDHLDDSRTQAVAQAEQGNGTGDFKAIKETLEPEAHAMSESALLGTWRCRQMKLGGMTGYYVFSWFPCRISHVGGGLWFEKDGTQRMAGFLYPNGGSWIYLGAQSARGEPIHRYSGQAASVGATANPDDQVGALVGIGNNKLRMDIPYPAVESDFDAIELVR